MRLWAKLQLTGAERVALMVAAEFPDPHRHGTLTPVFGRGGAEAEAAADLQGADRSGSKGAELEAVLEVAAEFPAQHQFDTPMPVFGRDPVTAEQAVVPQSTPLPGPDKAVLYRAVLDLVDAAAACASYCEHAEHCEPADISQVVAAAETLRRVAGRLAAQSQISLRQTYEDRIRAVETGSLHAVTVDGSAGLLVGADALAKARRWDQAQAAQAAHDRQYHPDVFGMPKTDQLRHYAFHVTKLAGLLAGVLEHGNWDGFRDRRLADIAVFGVKLATVCNQRLPATDIDQA